MNYNGCTELDHVVRMHSIASESLGTKNTTHDAYRRSLAVRGEIGSTMEGVLTPFLLDNVPPTTTSQVTQPCWSGNWEAIAMVVLVTIILSLPSSSSSVSPIRNVLRISGWGRRTRSLLPATSFRSKVKVCPSFRWTLVSAKIPTLSLGPCIHKYSDTKDHRCLKNSSIQTINTIQT